MVELQSQPLHSDKDSYVIIMAGVIMTYFIGFITMMLFIRMMLNCVFNHLLRRPHNLMNVVVIVE